jgi:diacylglycerol kinase family enzyme
VTRSLLIANPAAARTARVGIDLVANTLRSGGWEVEVLATQGSGHARQLAEYGVAEKVDVVAVFGGDGTTMQAAAALVGTDVPLGVIPGGFQYFAVACGAGYDARVMAATLSQHKRRWGMAAYAATTLRLIASIESTLHVITIDGLRYEVHAAMVLVANCGEVIPRVVRLAPGITPTDGLLDVVVMRADNLWQSLHAVWALLRTGPATLGEATPVGHARGREIRVESEQVQPVQLDGEPGGETPFTASVVPGAIRIMVPAGGGAMA